MFTRVLSSFADRAYALLRIVSGAMFAFHGVQKILGVLGGEVATSADPLNFVGAWIELVAGTAIAIGLFTRFAGFLASGEMAVAYVSFHWKGAFDANFFPGVNHGELALLYSFLFLYVACRGSGRWALDACLCKEPDHRGDGTGTS